MRLRAHFDEPPAEVDLEGWARIETEIFSDFFDDVSTETVIRIIAPGEGPDFLPDGAAYRRPLH